VTKLASTPEGLLLRAALAPDEAADGAYAEWRERQRVIDLDWPSHRVLALLHARQGEADDDVSIQIGRVVRMTWLKTQMLLAGALPAIRALRAAGVPVMLCKGLAVLHYTSWRIEQRPMDDVDVVVPLADAPAAATILRDNGFACPHLPADPGSASIYAQLHGLPFTNESGAEIDLHWHLLHDSLHADADRDFWTHARPATLRGVACLVPRREDVLLQVLSHGQEITHEHALLWAADAVLLLRSGGATFDWRRLEREASRHRLLPEIADALGVLAELDPGLVPVQVRRRVGRRPSVRLWPRAARGELEPSGPQPPGRGRRSADIAREWLCRNVAPGRVPTPAQLCRALAETWGLERPRQVPAHALWVLCRRPVAMARLRGRCSPAALEPVAPPCEIGFMSGEAGARHLRGGWWGYADVEGGWSRGAEAAVAVALIAGARSHRLRLEVEAVPHIGATHPHLAVDVYCDGRRVARWGYSGCEASPQTRSALLPRGGDAVELRFVIHGRMSPETARTIADPRPRGIALRKLRLERAPEG
jgi:hypothetical protein